MASCSSQLTTAEISKVTDIISADNSFRFCVEYLGINRNEFKTIEYNTKFIHHDTLFECIQKWKNSVEGDGLDARQELINILSKVQEEQRWFSKQDMAILFDEKTGKISRRRMKKIQDWNKDSLRRRLKKSLAHDWIRESRAHVFPLRKYYVQLEWRRKIREAMRTKTVTLTSIHELIREMQSESSGEFHQSGNSVLIEGSGGIGKSCSLGMVALDWAEDRSPELNHFSFVFLILLRHVNDDKSLESIILKQHGRLKTMRVTLSEMNQICNGNQEGNILYIFDGLDEYTVGTNSAIDEILLNGKDNAFIISSSRPGDFLKPFREQSDSEVTITGFSEENMKKCAALYIGDDAECADFFSQAREVKLYELLHIPIILLMACTVFIQKNCLPKSITQLFGQIVDMSISRTTLKTMGMKADEISNLEEMKEMLGILAWDALNRKSKELLLFKKDIIEASEDLLKLGLLFGQEVDLTTEDLPEVLSFQHKLIQEYLAAIYIAKQIKADAAFLNKAFPSWEKIEIHREVLRFTCGLLADHDASPVANHIANILVKHTHDQLDFPTIQRDLTITLDKKIIESCNIEGHQSALNPNLSVYPSCGCHLSDALKHSRFVLINGVNEHDPLQLSASSVPVILSIRKDKCSGKQRELNRLMNALTSSHINVQGIHTDVKWEDMCKISNFNQIKYIETMYDYMDVKQVKDLTDSINSLDSEPQLKSMNCFLPKISDRDEANTIYVPFMKALRRCTRLKLLCLASDGHMGDGVSVIMEAPPQDLTFLTLWCDMLQDEDVKSIAEAVKQHKLDKLEELDIGGSELVTEAAVISLIKTVLTVRPDKQLKITVPFSPSSELQALCKHTKVTAQVDQK